MDRLLSISEAAEICGLAARTLRKKCAKGAIEGAVQIGHQWCIPAEWAEAYRSNEDCSATHLPLAEAARIAGISRQGMIDRIESGAIEGFAQQIIQRKRWWVECESLARWIAEREGRKG